MALKSKKMKVNKDMRQEALLDLLLMGPKTMHDLQEAISNKLNIDYLIPEATRNRDLRDLRDQGFQIDLNYRDSREPEYILRKTKLELFCDIENINLILKFLKLGAELGMIEDSGLNQVFQKFSRLFKNEISPLKIEGLRRLITLNKNEINLINKAIEKNCSITFSYKQPSDSRIKSITAFPKEIFLQDKFLYLMVKRRNSTNKSFDWREYRMDRFVPIQDSKHIKINPRDCDPSSNDKFEPNFIKILVLKPLKHFFEPSLLGLIRTDSNTEYDMYEGYVYKSNFRILKDLLPFLPNIQVIANETLKQEFNRIIQTSYSNFIKSSQE